MASGIVFGRRYSKAGGIIFVLPPSGIPGCDEYDDTEPAKP
jgi:hypothetical protein